jgi:23S rRNA pseudouridine2457 synthase
MPETSIPNRYFILNKPYNMVSQFISDHPVRLLGQIKFNFPEGIHAIGRLDNPSEGLLILTTDKRVTKLLYQGIKKHKRTYVVLVLKKVTPETLEKLRTGVSFLIKGNEMYTTSPCEVDIIDEPNFAFPSPYKKSIYQEYTWLKITITEGKYRQIRKMVWAVKHRCVRLIRTSIVDLQLGDLQPGEIKELNANEFFGALGIDAK